jgi:hypothetical protein
VVRWRRQSTTSWIQRRARAVTDHPSRDRAFSSIEVSPDCTAGSSCWGVGCDNPDLGRGPSLHHQSDDSRPVQELFRFRDQKCSLFVIAHTVSREGRAVTRRAVARSAYGAAERLDRERAALVALPEHPRATPELVELLPVRPNHSHRPEHRPGSTALGQPSLEPRALLGALRPPGLETTALAPRSR